MRQLCGLGPLHGFCQKQRCATYWGYIGILEKKMETTTLYRDYIVVQSKRIMNLIRRGVFYYQQGRKTGGLTCQKHGQYDSGSMGTAR